MGTESGIILLKYKWKLGLEHHPKTIKLHKNLLKKNRDFFESSHEENMWLYEMDSVFLEKELDFSEN